MVTETSENPWTLGTEGVNIRMENGMQSGNICLLVWGCLTSL